MPCALCALLQAAAAQSPSPPSIGAMQVANPRAFGHFIGDPLRRTIELTVPQPFVLARRELPHPSRANAWLELSDLSVEARATPRETYYHIELVYQIVNSPDEVFTAMMPPVDLHFVADGRSLDAAIDSWPIEIAPLTDGAIRAGLEPLRPARAPLRVESGAAQIRFAITGLLAVAALGALALIRFGWPRFMRKPGPFAAAYRLLRSLAKLPAGTDRRHAALRVLHRAFDETLGRRLFAEQLDDFMAEHPKFHSLRDEARGFYELSRGEFFGRGTAGSPSNSAEPSDIERLTRLCARFKVRE